MSIAHFHYLSRHGLNGNVARNDGLETTSSWIASQPENMEKYPYITEEIISYYATGRDMSRTKIRRIVFHPSQYVSCRGALGLVESCFSLKFY
jgi:hypothetical protein